MSQERAEIAGAAAEEVLRMLQQNDRLRDLGMQADGVNWRHGFAHFVFRGASGELTRRASVRGLLDSDLAELALSLVQSLMCSPREDG